MNSFLKILCPFCLSVLCFSCVYKQYGVTSEYNNFNVKDYDSCVLFRPIVVPRIIYRKKLILKEGQDINGVKVDDIGSENSKCMTNSLIQKLGSKIETSELSEDLKVELLILFNKLITKNIDLNIAQLDLTSVLPKKTKIRWCFLIKMQPVESFMISIHDYPDQIVEQLYLQIIVYDNLKHKIEGYYSIGAHWLNYKVTNKRCEELINRIFERMHKGVKNKNDSEIRTKK